MKIDIKFKEKRYFRDWVIKRDITEPQIIINEHDMVIIKFYHNKAHRDYEFIIPKSHLEGIFIRRTE